MKVNKAMCFKFNLKKLETNKIKKKYVMLLHLNIPSTPYRTRDKEV